MLVLCKYTEPFEFSRDQSSHLKPLLFRVTCLVILIFKLTSHFEATPRRNSFHRI